MEQVPRIRRPQDIHTTDQIVGQAARNGWTVGITAETWLAPNAVRSLAYILATTNGFPAIV